MSYEIIYDKQFIKLKDNLFVPMLYWGSSNLFEPTYGGRERRSREWSSWNYITGGNFYATKEEILLNCDKLRQEKIDNNKDAQLRYSNWDVYDDKQFGYFSSIAIGGSTHNTSYGNFKGLFSTGCRKALTIEELKSFGVSVSITSYLYKNDYDDLGVKPYNSSPTNGDEFIEMIKEATERYKDTDVSISVRLNGAHERVLKQIRNKLFPRKKSIKKRIEVNQFYTITVGGRYFVRKLKYGYKYAPYPYVKYITKKEALNRIKNYGSNYKVELVKEKTTI